MLSRHKLPHRRLTRLTSSGCVLSRLVVSSATERVFSRVKWLEELHPLRLTESHLSDLLICNTNFELVQAVALDPVICQRLFG